MRTLLLLFCIISLSSAVSETVHASPGPVTDCEPETVRPSPGPVTVCEQDRVTQEDVRGIRDEMTGIKEEMTGIKGAISNEEKVIKKAVKEVVEDTVDKTVEKTVKDHPRTSVIISFVAVASLVVAILSFLYSVTVDLARATLFLCLAFWKSCLFFQVFFQERTVREKILLVLVAILSTIALYKYLPVGVDYFLCIVAKGLDNVANAFLEFLGSDNTTPSNVSCYDS